MTRRRDLAGPIVLAALSGCAALIYEVVWFQVLQLAIGSSAISLGVLLGVYMGGMCAGSLALPKCVAVRRHPLRVLAVLELGIGILGVWVWYWVPHADRLYAAAVSHGWPGFLLRGLVCALCLLPPTLLMGASLPAMARWVESSPRGVSWLGYLYGANIAGAVAGCLLAGFYLLRVYDMAAATFTAAAINGTVAAGAAGLAWLSPYNAPCTAGSSTRAGAGREARPVLAAIALSGLCALAAEVVWTRLLSLLLGATVYTFSVILAVFLVGLGIGGGAGAWLAGGRAVPRHALGFCQLLLAAAVWWAAYVLARVLPHWCLPAGMASSWWRFPFDFLRGACAILPAACLWGASFPLAVAAAARRGQDPGRLMAQVYAANTAGAIAGALGFSLVLIPWAGTAHCQRVLMGFSAAVALAMLAPLLRRLRRGLAVGACAASGLVVLLAASMPPVPWGVLAYGHQLHARVNVGKLLHASEGMNSSIVVSESNGVRMFHVSGKVEASSDEQDLRLERMLGHIPALFHPAPRSVLVVGCGAGITAGTFALYPGVERIVICEIEPRVPPLAARYFARENYGVLRDPRVRVVHDDARHYMLTSRETFDIITSDPIHPWVKGSATLYTREYFDLCRRRLNPKGVISQWVPLYESAPETVKSEIATFFEVFPQGTIWGNDTIFAEGYDTVLVGWAGEAKIRVGELEARLRRPGYARVRESLEEVGLGSAVSLLSTYAGQGPDLRRWLRRAHINRDSNLRLQYLAGLHTDWQAAWYIYADLLSHRHFPERLFEVSGDQEEALRRALR